MKPKNLTKHPEGGHYQEVYRSMSYVTNNKGDKRSALTHIYFFLQTGEISGFHKVNSDEIWNLYEGNGLILYVWDDVSNVIEEVILSKPRKEYCHVIPAGTWQAAMATDESVLVGCTVGPGFDFEDFTMMNIDQPEAKNLLKSFPDLEKLIKS